MIIMTAYLCSHDQLINYVALSMFTHVHIMHLKKEIIAHNFNIYLRCFVLTILSHTCLYIGLEYEQ